MASSSTSRPAALLPRVVIWITIRWLAQPGRIYQGQFKNSFSDVGWSDLGQPIPAGGNTVEVNDSVSASVPHRFYRVVLVE